MSKEKQIEEMARDICRHYEDEGICKANLEFDKCDCECWTGTYLAPKLYEAGYRKQSEGEWKTIPDYQPDKLIAYRHICSVCKTVYKDIRSHGHKYCHECGAKMKGGAE